MIEFLNLFQDEEFWKILCTKMNRRAAQVCTSKPDYYYAEIWKETSIEELKAFLGLRIQMEFSVIKPPYEDYWKSEAHNPASYTPGFPKVMSRDR